MNRRDWSLSHLSAKMFVFRSMLIDRRDWSAVSFVPINLIVVIGSIAGIESAILRFSKSGHLSSRTSKREATNRSAFLKNFTVRVSTKRIIGFNRWLVYRDCRIEYQPPWKRRGIAVSTIGRCRMQVSAALYFVFRTLVDQDSRSEACRDRSRVSPHRETRDYHQIRTLFRNSLLKLDVTACDALKMSLN